MSARRRVWTLLALGIMFGAAAVALAASDAELWQAAGVSPAQGSVMAAPFSLRDVAGRGVSLAQFRGRLVMLYFWAAW